MRFTHDGRRTQAGIAAGNLQRRSDVPRKRVVPRALEGSTLTQEGQTIEIRGTQGPLAHRPYACIPSLKVIGAKVNTGEMKW